MPSILVKKSDLLNLVGEQLNDDQLEDLLCLVKGELKRSEGGEDDIKIELNDTNRPDTWCVEGIARQLRYKLGKNQPKYDFFNTKGSYVVNALKGVGAVRPVIGAFVCRNIKVTEALLEQIIQSQEKLCENFGSKRRAVAIGVYNLDAINFPVIYRSSAPDATKFVPLQFEEEMTLQEILEKHPKGQQYAGLLAGFKDYPLLIDSANNVLSFPPVINSRLVGEVKTDSKSLFIEATGDDLGKVTLALNILAYNLADRGGQIESVTVNYEEPVEGNKSLVFPRRVENTISTKHADFEKLIGEKLISSDIVRQLEEYGCKVKVEGDLYTGVTDEYRYDFLHPVDLVEDYAISRGFNNITPEQPKCFTVGRLSDNTIFGDKARNILVGFGFEEVFSNMLISKDEIVGRTKIKEPMVEIENIMTENYGVVRNRLLPCLMRVESTSGKALYPHRFFEVGEVAVVDNNENHGNKTVLHTSFFIAHPKACFSELHSSLEYFLYYMGYEGMLEPVEEDWLIPGRSGKIIVDGKDVGRIGEIHPEVLQNWDIKVPCAVCEVSLSALLG